MTIRHSRSPEPPNELKAIYFCSHCRQAKDQFAEVTIPCGQRVEQFCLDCVNAMACCFVGDKTEKRKLVDQIHTRYTWPQIKEECKEIARHIRDCLDYHTIPNMNEVSRLAELLIYIPEDTPSPRSGGTF